MITLRPYQNAAVTAIRTSMRSGNKRPLFVLPTGGGKSIVLAYITQQAILKGSQVLVLVHRDNLFKQISATLKKFDVVHGLIGAGYPTNYVRTCQVGKVGTVVNRLDKFLPDLIIVDECHHATATQYRKIIEAYPNARVLGVTATPARGDGTGLGEIFDDIVIGPTINELIEYGFLVEPEIYAPPKKIDLSGVKRSAGDYNKKELGEIMDKPTITGDAVAHYTKICAGVPAVAFCVSISHAEHVSEMFRAAGYTSEPVHGKMKQKEIDRILNGLGNGSIQVVTSCDLISEGTDIPVIKAAILLRPTMSLSLFLQQVGRALRLADGKDKAIILDHVGNVERHGHPCDDREWTLEGKKKRKTKAEQEAEIVTVKVCESCFAAFRPAPVCPCCGWVVPVKSREIEVTEGELVKMENTRKKKTERKQESQCVTLADWEELARQRGYKKGWAYKRWKLRQSRGK